MSKYFVQDWVTGKYVDVEIKPFKYPYIQYGQSSKDAIEWDEGRQAAMED